MHLLLAIDCNGRAVIDQSWTPSIQVQPIEALFILDTATAAVIGQLNISLIRCYSKNIYRSNVSTFSFYCYYMLRQDFSQPWDMHIDYRQVALIPAVSVIDIYYYQVSIAPLNMGKELNQNLALQTFRPWFREVKCRFSYHSPKPETKVHPENRWVANCFRMFKSQLMALRIVGASRVMS